MKEQAAHTNTISLEKRKFNRNYHPLSLDISLVYFKTIEGCFLKSGSHLPKKFVLLAWFESPLKMMKNAFYFILKDLFVHKIFKFL